MTFEQWLTANGYDSAALTAKQRAHLESAWKAETQPPPVAKPAEPASTFTDTLAALESETKRQEYIRERTLTAIRANVGDPAKVAQLKTLCESAVADEKTNAQAFDLA